MTNKNVNLIGAIIASFVGGTVFNYNNMGFLSIPFGGLTIIAIYYLYIWMSKDFDLITGEQEIKQEETSNDTTN